MDGKGRAIDNIFIERLRRSVKLDHDYLHVAEDGVQLYNGLQEYFSFYSYERSHQSIEYETPADCYLQKKQHDSKVKRSGTLFFQQSHRHFF